ncbi:MAG: translation elongation factor Ts [Anaerolineae bacterium]|nr:translation elongation factor Ts [Anaerolineae bacterium]
MQVTAQMVKELREATGAAVLDCKNALVEHDGDMEKATEYLRQKGLAAAAKKADRVASEGLIETYTHPGGRVGVMVEVNCETDFVASTPQFEKFTHDLTLHVAFHAPKYVKVEDIPGEVADAKRAEFRAEALREGKPEAIVDKIIEGRMNKWYAESVLLMQPWIRDETGGQTVQDVAVGLIAELKENIVVSRFARFELGQADGAAEEV